MRVKCIDKRDKTGITENKIYSVTKETDSHFYIINDDNNRVNLFKDRFERIYSIEEIKNGKFAVEIDNEQDWNKLNKIFMSTSVFYGHKYYSYLGYTNLDCDWSKNNNFTIIKFNQIEFMEQQIKVGDTFYHHSKPKEIYTISEINNDKVKISWETDSTQYVLRNALDFIKEGTWILIKNENMKEFKVGDFVNAFNLNGEDYHEISKIQGNKFWIYFNPKVFEYEHNYKFLDYPDLKKKEMKNKTVVGYKLIKPEYTEAALKIVEHNNNSIWNDNLKNRGYCFGYNSIVANKLKEAGVLDLWFEKVYKKEYFKKGDWITIVNLACEKDENKILNKAFEIQDVQTKDFAYNEDVRYLINHDVIGIYHKCVRLATEQEIEASKTIIVPMTATNGNFEIEVSRGEIFYRPDSKELPVKFVEDIINSFKPILSDYSQPYTIKVESLTVGCKQSTQYSDWKKVLETYNSLQ